MSFGEDSPSIFWGAVAINEGESDGAASTSAQREKGAGEMEYAVLSIGATFLTIGNGMLAFDVWSRWVWTDLTIMSLFQMMLEFLSAISCCVVSGCWCCKPKRFFGGSPLDALWVFFALAFSLWAFLHAVIITIADVTLEQHAEDALTFWQRFFVNIFLHVSPALMCFIGAAIGYGKQCTAGRRGENYGTALLGATGSGSAAHSVRRDKGNKPRSRLGSKSVDYDAT
ncbi:unnamed protein product [Amoebophrya sp. A25]|nr:unnamed protein product [Amoebophrya sp. A25]|eukprot:GSA25T00013412001.1